MPTPDLPVNCPACGDVFQLEPERVRSLNAKLSQSKRKYTAKQAAKSKQGGRKPQAYCSKGHRLIKANRFPSGACRICQRERDARKRSVSEPT